MSFSKYIIYTRIKFYNTLITLKIPFPIKLPFIPSHKAITKLLSTIIFLLFPEFYIHFMCFVSGFFHLPLCFWNSSLLFCIPIVYTVIFARLHFIEYICHILFIHWPADGYLGCFYCLVSMNNAAMDICVQIFVWRIFSLMG